MIKNPCQEIWNLATEEIAEIYKASTFDLLEKRNPELYRKIHSAEDAVNLFWDKDLDSFRNRVDVWKDLMQLAVKAVSQIASGVKRKIASEPDSINIFDKIRGM